MMANTTTCKQRFTMPQSNLNMRAREKRAGHFIDADFLFFETEIASYD
jgi:hypothetical protein